MGLFKSLLQKIYLSVYDLLLVISPTIHNSVFFRKTNRLNFKNYKQQKVDKSLLMLDVFLDKNAVFIDVGANIGEYVNRAKKHISENEIFAFEPLPKLNKRLKKAFPNANVSQVALSDKKAKSTFKIPVINKQQVLTRATLNTNFVEVAESNKQLIEVETDTLDNQIKLLNINNISLLKIDVEGHEWKVINGAKKTLQKHQPIIIIEIEQRHHSFSIQQIIEDILKLNYSCYYFNLTTAQLLPVEDLKQLQNIENFNSSKYINNFVFVNNATPIAKFNDKLNRLTS